jgi:hypothetical protein
MTTFQITAQETRTKEINTINTTANNEAEAIKITINYLYQQLNSLPTFITILKINKLN